MYDLGLGPDPFEDRESLAYKEEQNLIRDIRELEGRLNLYEDDQYEDFRDVLTDNAMTETLSIRQPGETISFGNDCKLEVISNSPVNTSHNISLLSKIIEPWGIDLSSSKLIHSFLHLHMQAEVNIKIDIIWNTEETGVDEQPIEYTPIAVFFEDNGEGAFDDGPNFDPSNNSNWWEFLHDMGIGPDPFGDDED